MYLYGTGVVLAAARRPHGGPVMLILPILVIAAIVYFTVRRRRSHTRSSESRPSFDSPEIRRAMNHEPTETRSPHTSAPSPTPRPPVAGAEQFTDQPAIRLDNVTKIYGVRKAVDGLSFSVRPGAICGFVGPNGVGKRPPSACCSGSLRRQRAPPRSSVTRSASPPPIFRGWGP